MGNSKRIGAAALALVAVIIMLSAFVVVVYKGKRSSSDSLTDMYPSETASEIESVSGSDTPVSSDASGSSENDVSSQGAVSSEVSSAEVSSAEVSSDILPALTTDTKKNANEFIINPDYKSEFYMVVYSESQSIMVYQKDKKGGYTVKFMNMRCSVGTLAPTTSDEGVYRIQKKEKWVKLGDGMFGQYGCLIDKENGIYISSAPYSAKKPSSLIAEEYDKLGQPTENAGIQLCTRDAYWVHLNMPVGTQISLVNQKGPEPKAMKKRKTADKYNGWDPTDKWSSDNPYIASATTTRVTG